MLQYSIRFSIDIPRIFITLFETAARLLAYAPNGMEVLQEVKKELSSKRDPTLHSPYVKQLTDMGFSERSVLKALATKRFCHILPKKTKCHKKKCHKLFPINRSFLMQNEFVRGYRMAPGTEF